MNLRAATAVSQGKAAPPALEVKRDPALARAAKEFEAVFVRQILTTAKVGGAKPEAMHATMIVDALAGALEGAGGLGLAKAMEDAVRIAHRPAPRIDSSSSPPDRSPRVKP